MRADSGPHPALLAVYGPDRMARERLIVAKVMARRALDAEAEGNEYMAREMNEGCSG